MDQQLFGNGVLTTDSKKINSSQFWLNRKYVTSSDV